MSGYLQGLHFIIIHQVSIGGICFVWKRFNDTHVRYHFAKLPLNCHLQPEKRGGCIGRKVQHQLPYAHHEGDIIFGVTLMQVQHAYVCSLLAEMYNLCGKLAFCSWKLALLNSDHENKQETIFLEHFLKIWHLGFESAGCFAKNQHWINKIQGVSSWCNG